MTRGVLMYAHNNSEIDYFKIACANSLMIRNNLKVPVTVVTDEGTLAWAKSHLTEEFINLCFENVILVDKNRHFENNRIFSDTTFSSKPLQFYNCNHHDAYQLSPYDETLFIDADYLIMSSALDKCWGSDKDVMIDYRTLSPGSTDDAQTTFIDDFGIKLYWATVIYFKKTEFSKFLFSLVGHVQENYRYYYDLYCFTNGMFRNDNAFSIAIHTLNGFVDTDNSVVGNLPIQGLMMSWDTDDIHSIKGINDILIYANRKDVSGQYLLARLRNTDVHIMNKWAASRSADRIIELYKEG